MADAGMSYEETKRLHYVTLLEACVAAEAAGRPLDVSALAQELEVPPPSIEVELEELDGWGLIALDDPLGPSAVLSRAGRQYLERDGIVPRWELQFLGSAIDDLSARAALLHAGTAIVDEFRDRLLAGTAAQYAAQEILPAAFAHVVTDRFVLDLYAAAVALMARLSGDEPAGCVAEEVVAVAVIEAARAWLEIQEEQGELDQEQAQAALGQLGGLFDLFQDDEVLALFDMKEPADAAVALHDPGAGQRPGLVDQRVQSWFEPFGWTAPTGYLTRR